MRQAIIPAPEVLCPPFGKYSHAVLAPTGAQLLYLSGQVGVRPDGAAPPGFIDQVEQTYRNIGLILEANNMAFEHVIKLTTFIVMGHSIADIRPIREKYLGEARPCATGLFVPALAHPDWLIEIEAIAAK